MTDAFTGFDTSIYPGAEALVDAVAQGFSWTAPYLVAPSHSDDSWPDYPTLAATGLNLVPIFVGAQIVGPGSHDVGQAQGAAEAQDCLAKMKALLYPSYIGVAFDTENGPPISEVQTQHLQAWADGISAGGRKPMAYGSYQNFDALAAIFGPDSVWVYMLRDSPPEYQGCACQWQQNVPITLAGKSITIDRNVSRSASPAGAAPAPTIITIGNHTGVFTPGNMTQQLYVGDPIVSVHKPPPFGISTIPPSLPPVPKASPVVRNGPQIAAGATATAILGTAAASGFSVNVHALIDQLWPLLASGIVLPLIVWLVGRGIIFLHIQAQGVLADQIRTTVENAASFALSEAQSYADAHATINVKSAQQAAAINYVTQAIPTKLAQAGITQQQLANLVTAKLAQASQ